MKTHEVKPNETLSEIAERYDVSVDHLVAMNLGVTNPDVIQVGMILFVSGEILHTVKSGETLSEIASFYRVKWREMAALNNLENPDEIHAGQELRVPHNFSDVVRFVWPTDYKVVTQVYGANPDWAAYVKLGGHEGIDIRARANTPIYAIESGEVTSVVRNHHAYGNFVRIQHPSGFSALYAHANEILVSKGDVVTRGQEIMKAGSTGNSTAAHLHLTMFKNKERVNPAEFLPMDGVRVL